VVTAASALLVAIALAACGGDAGGPRGGGPPPAVVEAVRVETRVFSDVIELVGQLESEESVELRPEIAGVVASFEFAEGDRVKRGDVLFRLRSERQRASLREASARRALAADVFRRTQELARKQVSAVAELDRARAELDAADASVEIAKVELDRTEIRAPFDGSLGARRVSPGDRVDSDTVLVQIDAIDRLQLRFTLPEAAVGLARTGMQVGLSVASFPGERFEGEVFFVAPALDPENRRIGLKAWVPNPGHRLRPGMFANLDAEVERIDAALIVPESAIVYDARGPFVWRLGEGNVAARADVALGPRRAAGVVIRSGVASGDLVVSAGTHKVFPGAAVQIAQPATAVGAPPPPAPEARGGS
jgi:membrane fusion protein (multidrug efflux system)